MDRPMHRAGAWPRPRPSDEGIRRRPARAGMASSQLLRRFDRPLQPETSSFWAESARSTSAEEGRTSFEDQSMLACTTTMVCLRRKAAAVSLAGVGNPFARVSFIASLRVRGAALSKPVGAGAEIT